MERALDLDAALLVYPGGDHETYRPSWESAKIDLAGRTGLRPARARARHARSCPWSPSAARRPPSSSARAAASRELLRLDRLLRLKVLPAQVGPPYGVTVMDLPGRIPLPAKITDSGAAEDRPAQAARPRSGRRRGLRARHRAPCSARSTSWTRSAAYRWWASGRGPLRADRRRTRRRLRGPDRGRPARLPAQVPQDGAGPVLVLPRQRLPVLRRRGRAGGPLRRRAHAAGSGSRATSTPRTTAPT